MIAEIWILDLPRVHGRKFVSMIPLCERTADLSIGEERGRLILGMFGDPANGDAEHGVFQHHSAADRERLIAVLDANGFPRRHQSLQRPRPLVIGERLLDRCRQRSGDTVVLGHQSIEKWEQWIRWLMLPAWQMTGLILQRCPPSGHSASLDGALEGDNLDEPLFALLQIRI